MDTVRVHAHRKRNENIQKTQTRDARRHERSSAPLSTHSRSGNDNKGFRYQFVVLVFRSFILCFRERPIFNENETKRTIASNFPPTRGRPSGKPMFPPGFVFARTVIIITGGRYEYYITTYTTKTYAVLKERTRPDHRKRLVPFFVLIVYAEYIEKYRKKNV